MKRSKESYWFTSVILLAILVGCACVTLAEAAEYCVSTPNELRSAFMYAAVNGEDDLIKLVQGTYSGSFAFSADEAYAATIQGGYTSGCASRVVDASNTILDPDNLNTALVLASSKQADFVVDGLTLQHGKATNSYGGGGLYVTTAGGDLVVTNSVIQNNSAPDSGHEGGGVYVSGTYSATFNYNTVSANSAHSSGGGIYVATGAEVVTLTNNTITGNSLDDYYSDGGGVYIDNANTILMNNNTIQENSSTREGGGIHINGGVKFAATNNTIIKNSIVSAGSYPEGGGIYLYGVAQVSLTDNIIRENNVTYSYYYDICGGGIYITGTNDLNMLRNMITDNTLLRTSSSTTRDVLGGGGYISASNANISDNMISNNSASAPTGDILGGGLYLSGTQIYTLSGNEIIGNSAGYGGGIYASNSSSLKLVNNIVAKNSAGFGGGGLVADYATSTTLTNNTITGNSADEEGGGVRILLEGETDAAHLYNNIIWNNSAPTGKDIYVNNDGDGDWLKSEFNLFHNDVDTTYPTGIYFEIVPVIDASNLNNVDPVFVDASGNDYHLGNGSPCMNVGKNDAPSIPEIDKDGYARIIDTNVDLGAYEAGQIVLHGKLRFSSAAYTVNEDTGSLTVTVLRTDGSSGTVSVQYATSDGTAQAGSDYTAQSGTLTFPSGVTVGSFTVPIASDALMEGAETVTLTLSTPTGGALLGSPSTAVLTISEGGSSAAVLSLADTTGGAGATDVAVAVSLDNATDVPAVGALELRIQYDAGIGIHANGAKYNLTSRTNGFTASIKVMENGSNSEAHILLYSTEGAVIAPGTGSIFELLFNVDASAATGATSALSFTQSLVSDAAGSEIPSQRSDTATFTVGDSIPGDMNGDGTLNVFDLQRMINCIFGSGSCNNGDMNGDGTHNIFDLQQLINKIFS